MARRRSRKRRQKKTTIKKGLGEAIFFGLAFILALVAFFLNDYYGIQFRFSGSYIWLAAYFFAFGGYLFYLVQFILPLNWSQSWYQGLRLSLPYNFPILNHIASLFLSRPRAPAATEDAQESLSQGFLTHKAGVIPSHQALALISGSQYSRSAGPGFVRLNPSETVAQVVNLRRHMRRVNVKAMSSDGIPIELAITIIFQVKQEDLFEEPEVVYPYDTSAIFWVNYLENFETDQGGTTWSERIEHEIESLLVEELSRYSLDQLFQQDQNSAPSLTRVRARLQNKLTNAFLQYDISLLQVFLSKVELPDEIVEQRISVWQADRHKQVEQDAMKEVFIEEQRRDLAETVVQVEIIQRILDDIEAVRDSGGTDLADAVLISVAEAMKTAAADERVMSVLSEETEVELQQTISTIKLIGP